jgi:ribosomal protein L5
MGITSSDGVSDIAAAQERETTAGEQKMLWVARTKVNAWKMRRDERISDSRMRYTLS